VKSREAFKVSLGVSFGSVSLEVSFTHTTGKCGIENLFVISLDIGILEVGRADLVNAQGSFFGSRLAALAEIANNRANIVFMGTN